MQINPPYLSLECLLFSSRSLVRLSVSIVHAFALQRLLHHIALLIGKEGLCFLLLLDEIAASAAPCLW